MTSQEGCRDIELALDVMTYFGEGRGYRHRRTHEAEKKVDEEAKGKDIDKARRATGIDSSEG